MQLVFSIWAWQRKRFVFVATHFVNIVNTEASVAMNRIQIHEHPDRVKGSFLIRDETLGIELVTFLLSPAPHSMLCSLFSVRRFICTQAPKIVRKVPNHLINLIYAADLVAA